MDIILGSEVFWGCGLIVIDGIFQISYVRVKQVDLAYKSLLGGDVTFSPA